MKKPVTVRIEDYMLDSIKAFESRADQIIPSLFNRTKVLDDNYKTKTIQDVSSIIVRCFPQYVVNHSTKWDNPENRQLIVWQCHRRFVTLQRPPDGPITGLFGGIFLF